MTRTQEKGEECTKSLMHIHTENKRGKEKCK